MAFITLANTHKIIFNSDIRTLDLSGEIYRLKIYFLSRYEENALLAIQELLKDPEKYFTEIYKPFKAVDTYKLVYEGKQPSYHKDSNCQRLHAHYKNFEIPSEISEKGPEEVQRFRLWFEGVKHLLEKPDVFVERLRLRWGVITNPRSISHENSGSTELENMTVEELEKRIDSLIKEAAKFYYETARHTTILKKLSKYTYLAYKPDPISNNDTGFSDDDVKSLLRDYDEEFKRPLKRDLIEYYRLKFNPEIKMEGYLLEKLGFSPCGHCHNDYYAEYAKPE